MWVALTGNYVNGLVFKAIISKLPLLSMFHCFSVRFVSCDRPLLPGLNTVCINHRYVCTYVPYAYKFLGGCTFRERPGRLHLAIFSILISRKAACSSKLIPYVYTFSRFYFHHCLFVRKIHENLYAYGIPLRKCVRMPYVSVYVYPYVSVL